MISWPIHYTGETFDAQRGTVAVPAAGTARRAPAAGGIQVSNHHRVGGGSVRPARQVRLTCGYRRREYRLCQASWWATWTRQANSIYLADSDYLASPDTREAGGVYYPDLGR